MMVTTMARHLRAATSNLAPRAEAASEQYELVAIARGGDLVIYLDRFATNESVDGASIEVETPAGPQPARAMAERAIPAQRSLDRQTGDL